jgi:hypothetical protein
LDNELIERLKSLPDAEFLAVLQEVFHRRQSNAEENDYNRNQYFLGTASSLRESDDGEPERWAPWSIEAVAYIDRDAYPEGVGPDWGFCQFATCQACQMPVRSNVKNGICPVCGSKVYMS